MNGDETVRLEKYITPANGDNAIVAVALLIEFSTPVDPATIGRFANLNGTMLKWGYAGNAIHTASIAFLSNPSAAQFEVSTQRQPLSGHSFARTDSSRRQIKEISLRDQQLLLLADRYTRWEKLWSEVQEVLQTVVSLLNGFQFTSITLEYADQFRTRSGVTKFPVSEVLEKSDFVPQNVQNLHSAWHSVHGYLRDADRSGFASRVDNITISLAVAPNEPQILSITCQHKYMNPAGTATHDLHLLQQGFENAHLESKKIMAALLTPAAQDLISLNVPSPSHAS